MKKAIITGASGFIGRYLTGELLKEGYEVYALIRPNAQGYLLPSDEHIHIIELDMSEYGKLEEYADLQDVPLLYHLAWRGVSDVSSRDYRIQLENAKNSCDLMLSAGRLGVKRFVFADSIMEFEHLKAMTEEYHPLPMRNMYHTAKFAARSMLGLLATSIDMDFVPCVVSNVYGVGENSPRLINTAIRNMLADQHMSFTEGKQLYDFIYIEDAVRAIRIAGEEGKSDKIYYIGNEEPRPLRDYLLEMRDVLAPTYRLGLGELTLQGTSLDYRELDTTRLYRETGYQTEISFAEGIRRTADWIHLEERRNHENDNDCNSNLQ